MVGNAIEYWCSADRLPDGGFPATPPAASGSQLTGLTKGQVGLDNVDNTTDLNKPVSTATHTALDLKAPLDSPTFTGTPAAPAAAAGTNTTQVATTAYAIYAAQNAAQGRQAAPGPPSPRPVH